MVVAIVEAALPDPANPAIVPLAAVLGGFLGALFARLRGLPAESGREFAETGAFYTTAIGLAAYTVAQIGHAI